MIDYNLISESLGFYEGFGYLRIEAPWTVSEEVDNITKPKDRISYKLEHNGKCLVASGEQSFLYLYLKNFLPKGQFQTVTPCFRNESFDFLHTKYFIKNELIITERPDYYNLDKIVVNALDFFKRYFDKNLLDTIKTEDGFDIELIIGDKRMELGSYGIRECEFLKWIYGTGCAEPRTSNLIKLYGKQS